MLVSEYGYKNTCRQIDSVVVQTKQVGKISDSWYVDNGTVEVFTPDLALSILLCIDQTDQTCSITFQFYRASDSRYIKDKGYSRKFSPDLALSTPLYIDQTRSIMFQLYRVPD
jgi:hypothetical protein